METESKIFPAGLRGELKVPGGTGNFWTANLFESMRDQYRSYEYFWERGISPSHHVSSPELTHYNSVALKNSRPIYMREVDAKHSSLVVERGWYGDSHRFHEAVEDGARGIEIFRSLAARREAYSPGSVNVNGGELVIKPTISRPREMDPMVLAEELYLNQFTHKEWQYLYCKPGFFIDCVHDYVDPKAGPIKWATDALSIVNGVLSGVSHDFAPLAAEMPYRRLAKFAANLHPEDRPALIVREIDSWTAKLLEAASDKLALNPLSAEFIVNCSDFLTPKLIQSPNFQHFCQNAERYVHAGLYPTQLIQAYRSWCGRGEQGEGALIAITQLADQLYSGCKQRPWWFRENIDLSAVGGHANLTPEVVSRLLKSNKHALEYALPVAAEALPKLERFSGVSDGQRHNFLAQVVREYGVGNEQRAKNVLELATTLLNQTPESFQARALAVFSRHLSDHKSPSEILNCLEGSETSTSLSGLWQAMVQTVPAEKLRRLKLDPLTIGPEAIGLWAENIKIVSNRFSAPLLLTGASAQSSSFLLSSYTDTKALALPEPRSGEIEAVKERPFLAYLVFESLLKREVPLSQQNSVALSYWHFYARKFDNPFSPPAGFLSALGKFTSLQDPEWQFTGLCHPREREEVAEKNRSREYDRQAIVSNLLDVANLGIISYDQVTALLNWVSNPIDARTIREAQIESSFEYQKQELERARCSYSVQMGLEELEQKLASAYQAHARVVKRRHLGREAKDGLDEWREEQWLKDIAEIQKKINGVPADACWYDDDRAEWKTYKDSGFSREESDADLSVARDFDRRISDIAREQQTQRQYLLHLASGILFSDAVLYLQRCLDLDQAKNIAASQLAALQSNKLEISADDLPDLRSFGETMLGGLKRRVISGPILFTVLQDFSEPETYITRLVGMHKGVGQLQEYLEGFSRKESSSLPSFTDIVEEFRDGLRVCFSNLEQTLGVGIKNLVTSLVDEAGVRRYLLDELKVRMLAQLGNVAMGNLPRFMERYDLNPVAELAQLNSTYQYLQGMEKVSSVAARAFERWAGQTKVHENILSESGLRALTQRAEGLRVHLGRLVMQESPIDDEIRKGRVMSFGLLPIGGKIHTHQPMDSRILDNLHRAGFSQTSFRLLHANKSLNLPAVPSAVEFVKILKHLEDNNILSWDMPEVQLCLPGRLPEDVCAILGSVTMLISAVMPAYDRNFFATSHFNETGRMAMLYDAGGPRSNFYFTGTLPGRTDILGRRAPDDTFIYQLVGSVLSHHVDTKHSDRFLAELAPDFIANVTETLRRHGLGDILAEPWVFQHRSAERCEQHFDSVITPIMEAYRACVSPDGITGVVAELSQLVDELGAQVRAIQTKCLHDPRYLAIRQAMGLERFDLSLLE